MRYLEFARYPVTPARTHAEYTELEVCVAAAARDAAATAPCMFHSVFPGRRAGFLFLSSLLLF